MDALHALEAERVATRQGHRRLRTNIEAAEADLAEVDGRFWHVEVEILVFI